MSENMPIMVGSTRVTTTMTAVRYLMVFAGGTLVSRGYLTDTELNDVVGAVLIIVPTVWGAYIAWRNNNQKKTMAQALPDSIAQVTHEKG